MDLERFTGFRDAFGKDNCQLVIIPMHKEDRWNFYRENLSLFKKNSAVFAVSDYYAIDLMSFLNEQGIKVPEQLSVAGFDDIPLCQLVTPTLTTIKQDGALRASIALTKLKELKEKKETETTVMLPVKLVIRQSTSEPNL